VSPPGPLNLLHFMDLPPLPPSFKGELSTARQDRIRFSQASGPFVFAPLGVVRPADEEDLATVLSHCNSHGIPLIARGGGTAMPGGNVGRALILDLSGPAFGRIGTLEPDQRRVEVGPGVVAKEVERVARAAGCTLPPLPSSWDRCTVGGMAGTNAAGARSFKHGAMRQWIEGIVLITADGRRLTLDGSSGFPPDLAGGVARAVEAGGGARPLLTHWPAVRKNSSGYALDHFLPHGNPVQLIVGSEGTLGIIASVTLRLAPLETARGVVVLPLPSDELIPEVIRIATQVGASACEFLGRRLVELIEAGGETVPGLMGTPRSLMVLEVEGDPPTVHGALASVVEEATLLGLPVVVAREAEEMNRLWGIRHAASPTIQAMAARGLRSVQVVEDSVVPPGRVAEYIRGVETILGARNVDHVLFGHAGDGNLHLNPLVDLADPATLPMLRQVLEEITALVAALGGTLTGEHGDGRLRAPLLHRIWGEEPMAAFRGIKDIFDPGEILNPGVILPLQGQDPLAGLGARVEA
jgi:FAD/FMN-containing dehydrogenase